MIVAHYRWTLAKCCFATVAALAFLLQTAVTMAAATPEHQGTGLSWANYLGGENLEGATAVAIDAETNIVVVGYTYSPNWLCEGLCEAACTNAFVVKLNPEGELLWSTLLGGTNVDYGNGIGVDTNGNVFACGFTKSSGWVQGGYKTNYQGGYDAFVVKLNSNGVHRWSSYLGGTNGDGAYALAVDKTGSVFVAGYTKSKGWAKGGYNTSLNKGQQTGTGDAFVAKLNTTGAHVWSTYLGGGGDESSYGIAIDSAGNVITAGGTASSGWVIGGYDTTQNGSVDGFVAKLKTTGIHVWSTFVGGTNNDLAVAISANNQNAVFVTGWTQSGGWTRNGYNTTYNGGDTSDSGNYDSFVVKINTSGGSPWSTYVGGSMRDRSTAIATDSLGNVYAAGYTESKDWVYGGADSTHAGGTWDGYLLKLSGAGTRLWASYVGGTQDDFLNNVTLQGTNTIVVVGETLSPSLVDNSSITNLAGPRDAFVAKLYDYTGTNAVPYIFSITRSNAILSKVTLSAAGYNASRLQIEGASQLGTGLGWTVISDTVFVSLGSGRFEATVPDHGAPLFYRVKIK